MGKRHLPRPLKTLRRSLQRHLPKNLQLHRQLQKGAPSLLRRLSSQRNRREDERCFSINAFLKRWSHCFANVLDSKRQSSKEASMVHRILHAFWCQHKCILVMGTIFNVTNCWNSTFIYMQTVFTVSCEAIAC